MLQDSPLYFLLGPDYTPHGSTRVGFVFIPVLENHLIVHKVVLDPVKDFIVGRAIDFEVGCHAFCMLTIRAAADGYTELRRAISAGYTYYVIKMVSNRL